MLMFVSRAISGPSDTVGTEVLRFDLGEEFSVETAIVVCEIYRSGNEWKFNAVGAGYQGWSRGPLQELWRKRVKIANGGRTVPFLPPFILNQQIQPSERQGGIRLSMD